MEQANIRPLPDNVRLALRSGMNCLNLSQCIMELVYNSIDAGASSIAVRVGFGKLTVEVVDNGSGIPEVDLQKIGDQFMSNKCDTLRDFQYGLKYYGYRGESLSNLRNICAIIKIHTRPRGSSKTYLKMFQQGTSELVQTDARRPNHGTTVILEDIMYNLPIRKNQVNKMFDLEDIKKQLQAIAVVNPQLSLTFRENTSPKMILTIDRSYSSLNVLSAIFGPELTKYMKFVKYKKRNFKVSGYISCKSDKDKKIQFVYVNRRCVTNSKIHKCINALMAITNDFGQKQNDKAIHALYCLNIECPQAHYHISFDLGQNKVEFKRWHNVLEYIKCTVNTFLKQENLIQSYPKLTSIPILQSVPVNNNCGVSQMEHAFKSKLMKRQQIDTDERQSKKPRIMDGDELLVSKKTIPMKSNSIDLSTQFPPVNNRTSVKKRKCQHKSKAKLLATFCSPNNSLKKKSKNTSKLGASSRANTICDRTAKLNKKSSNKRDIGNIPEQLKWLISNKISPIYKENEKRCKKTSERTIKNGDIARESTNNTDKRILPIPEHLRWMFQSQTSAYNANENQQSANNISSKFRILNENISLTKNNPSIFDAKNEIEINCTSKTVFTSSEAGNIFSEKCWKLNKSVVNNTNTALRETFLINPITENHCAKLNNPDKRKPMSTVDMKNDKNKRHRVSKFDNNKTCSKGRQSLGNYNFTHLTYQNHNKIFVVKHCSQNTITYQSHCGYSRAYCRQYPKINKSTQTEFHNVCDFRNFECNQNAQGNNPLRNSIGNIFTKLSDSEERATTKNKHKYIHNSYITKPLKRHKNSDDLICTTARNQSNNMENIFYKNTNITTKMNFGNNTIFDNKPVVNECIISKSNSTSIISVINTVDLTSQKHLGTSCKIQLPSLCDKSFILNKFLNFVNNSYNSRNTNSVLETNERVNVHGFAPNKNCNKTFSTPTTFLSNTLNSLLFKTQRTNNIEKWTDEIYGYSNQQYFPNFKDRSLDQITNVNDIADTVDEIKSPKNVLNKYNFTRSIPLQNKLWEDFIQAQKTSRRIENQLNVNQQAIFNAQKLNSEHLHNQVDLETKNSIDGPQTASIHHGKSSNKFVDKIFKTPSGHNNTKFPPTTPIASTPKCPTNYEHDFSFSPSPIQYKLPNNIFASISFVHSSSVVSTPKFDNSLLNKNNLRIAHGESSSQSINPLMNSIFHTTNQIERSKPSGIPYQIRQCSKILELSRSPDLFQNDSIYTENNANKLPYEIFKKPSINPITTLPESVFTKNTPTFPISNQRDSFFPPLVDNEVPNNICRSSSSFVYNSSGISSPIFKSSLLTNKTMCETSGAIRGQSIIPTQNPGNHTTNWIERSDLSGTKYFVNVVNGMTTYSLMPELTSTFEVCLRNDYLPKGMSQIYENNTEANGIVFKELTSDEKMSLMKIIQNDDELNRIKWHNENDAAKYLDAVIDNNIVISTLNKFNKVLLQRTFTKSIFKNMVVINQVDKKFIAAILKDGKSTNSTRTLILFDQHAVHERIRLETLLEGYRNDKNFISFQLPEPIFLIMEAQMVGLLVSHCAIFLKLGIVYDILTDEKIKIIGVPTCLYNKFAKELQRGKNILSQLIFCTIEETIEFLINTRGQSEEIPRTILNVIISEACRGAIKFGDYVTLDECKKLIDELSRCTLPFQCAHGRPTLVPLIDLPPLTHNTGITTINLSKLREWSL